MTATSGVVIGPPGVTVGSLVSGDGVGGTGNGLLTGAGAGGRRGSGAGAGGRRGAEGGGGGGGFFLKVSVILV